MFGAYWAFDRFPVFFILGIRVVDMFEEGFAIFPNQHFSPYFAGECSYFLNFFISLIGGPCSGPPFVVRVIGITKGF